jgi:hypothetical protein
LAHEPAKWYDDKACDPPRITALANIAFQMMLEGYYYRHVQAIIVATHQYPEAALELREYFLNSSHRDGLRRLKR